MNFFSGKRLFWDRYIPSISSVIPISCHLVCLWVMLTWLITKFIKWKMFVHLEQGYLHFFCSPPAPLPFLGLMAAFSFRRVPPLLHPLPSPQCLTATLCQSSTTLTFSSIPHSWHSCTASSHASCRSTSS